MERDLYPELVAWKGSADRKPLIIRGVRQCGKTYLMKQFGEREFSSVAYLKFEGNETLCRIFDGDLRADRLLASLSVYLGMDISEDTLIIFDEIQECPRALTSLKSFREDSPEHCIVCAGSLLGLQGKGSFPVGKVSFKDLYPMSFREFLRARNERLHNLVIGSETYDQFVADELKKVYSEYMMVGGMPEAVEKWIESGSMAEVERVIEDIDRSYKFDFLKHVPDRDIKKVNMIWDSIPFQLASENRRFFFGHAVKGARSGELEDALQWLSDAGMVYKVPRIGRPRIPLSPDPSERMFKLYMADVGLLRHKAGITPSDMSSGRADPLFMGGLAENLAMCELVSYGCPGKGYWASERKAEVDFLVAVRGILPIEVKSSDRYRAASLKEFIDRYEPERAVVLSLKDLDLEGPVARIPLYSVWRILDLRGEDGA